jgi:hypothetical protein
MPGELLESEFFGYGKGPFTDAKTDKPGRFQMAEGGTIFLDEIGELPLNLQAKLLQVLDEKTFYPLGASKPVVGIFYAFHLWDGWPYTPVQKQPWRFLFFAVVSLIIGYVIFRVQLFIFDYLWYEAYIGGQNEANFGWRYSHTVTMANFVLVIALIQNVFFGQAYEKMNAVVRSIIKTIVAVVVGLLFAWAYYAWGPALLGVCEGVSHPSENAAAFLIMVINLIMIQDYFMDRWPGYRLKK